MTDIRYFNDLYTDFEQLVDSADQTADEPRRGAANSPSPGSLFGGRRLRRLLRPSQPVFPVRHAWLAAAASLVALPAVVAGGFMVTSSPTNSATPQASPRRHALPLISRGPLPPFSVSEPLLDSHVVSEATAASALSVPQLPLPSASVVGNASVGSVTEAQDTSDSGAVTTYVAVTYPAASLVVEYESPVPYPDPAEYYSTYVSQTPSNLQGLASVGTVGGGPALVLQENKGSTGSNPASVEFVHDGLKVAVIGYRSASSLLTVADSVASN